MSTVRTIANNLNPSYPVPGTNNSSQGFRDNTAATQNALWQASDELSKLQSTRIQFTGDASGLSGSLDTTTIISGSPTFEVPLTLSSIVSPTSLDTRNTDIQVSIDAKGRITLTGTASSQVVWNWQGANTPIEPSVSSLGSGTGTVQFPSATFDNRGRLVSLSSKSVSFGLLNHTLTSGSLLVGDSQNKSSELASPLSSGSFVLVSNSGVLSWQAANAGTVTGVIAGNGIEVIPAPNSPTVGLDLANTPLSQNITANDLIVWHDVVADVAKTMTWQAFRVKTVSLSLDATPQLGGDLNLDSYKIVGNAAQPTIVSALNSPASTLEVSQTRLRLQGSVGTPLELDAPSLKLNGLEWPTQLGTSGQFLTLGPASTLVWSSPAQFFQTIPLTIFVGSQGNDTSGNGSLNSPYQTISKALSLIPNNSPDLYTIMLLGGVYEEDFELDLKSNVALEGFFSSSNTVLKGKVNLLTGINSLLVSRITFDLTSQPANDYSPVINLFGTLNKVEFKDCEILRGPGTLSDLPVIQLSGSQTSDVLFTNCVVQGQVINNLISNNNARLVINNSRPSVGGWMTLRVDPQTYTYVNNHPLLSGVEHRGGILSLENINSIRSADLVFNSTTYQAGILSSGNQDPLNKLELNNVQMTFGDTFSAIKKIGTCAWSFNRVKRRSDVDVINGARISYDIQPDEAQMVTHLSANGTTLLDSNTLLSVSGDAIDPQTSKSFAVTLTGNTTLSIKTPSPTLYAPGPNSNSGEMLAEISIAVIQDSQGYHDLTWNVVDGQPITWLTSNSIVIDPQSYTFYILRYFSRDQIWIGQKVTSNETLKVTNNTGSTKTIGWEDANAYLRLNHTLDNLLIVPNHATLPLPIGTKINLVQSGTGQTQIQPASSVVINSPYGLKLRAQMSNAQLIKIGLNAWDLSGDLDTTVTLDPTTTVDNTNTTTDSTVLDVTG